MSLANAFMDVGIFPGGTICACSEETLTSRSLFILSSRNTTPPWRLLGYHSHCTIGDFEFLFILYSYLQLIIRP